MMLFLMACLGILTLRLFISLMQARKEAVRQQQEIDTLRSEYQRLGDILRCPQYGLASQLRRIRTHNMTLLIAPEPKPYINRLEPDLKLEIMLGKLALWGVNNTVLGTADTSPLTRWRPELYERLAVDSDEPDELSPDISLLCRLNDETLRRHTPGSQGYKSLLQASPR
ncbi:hypothetical protein YB29_003779 [Salmonella enterica subsp. enterica]|nr:hypothetical protein [Salmonella enterica subsp. enterica]EDV1188843.1 hypothetical protein [Salmonella enterica subsp. enterica]